MRRGRILLFAGVFAWVAGASACASRDDIPTPPAGSTTAPATPVLGRSGTPAGAPGAGLRDGPPRLRGCPSAVDGATTVISDLEGGVAIHVTAENARAVADIRARASGLADRAIRGEVLDELGSDEPVSDKRVSDTPGPDEPGSPPKHRLCPVVLRDVHLVAEEITAGVVIEIRLRNPSPMETDWLRREVRRRNERLQLAMKHAG